MRRDELDLYLLELATQAQRHPPHSQERQIALTKLIHSIVRSGNLWYPSNQFFSNVQDIYKEARQELFLYICQNIDKYEPKRGTVMAWVNVLLERRFFKDIIRKNQTYGCVTKMTITDLDNLVLPEQPKDLTEIVKECIKSDPEDLFKNEHIEKCPQATSQALAMRRISGKSWKEISAEFGIKVPTVILFFAGHSETANDTGRIYINKFDSLSITELEYGLKRAIEQGLQLAIFNSCDGLGLAWQLACLNIPQMIVMREPVPDEVAQEFLKHFLTAFSGGKSLYLASREAREKLQGLEDKFPNATWLPVLFQNPRVVPLTWKELGTQQTESKRHFLTVLVVSVAIAASVMGVRYQGMLQPWELQAYDHLMQLRPASESSDPRLLVVTVDDADIHYQNQNEMIGRGSLSDKALAELLQKLEKYQPTTIGIDIYRDYSVDPNYLDLVTRLKQDDRIFAVCKVPAEIDGAADGIHPPYEVPTERQTFSDFVADDDEVARRQLLFLTPPPKSPCTAEYAFSLLLARHYLLSKGIKADITPSGYLQFGKVLFKPLKEHSSGYQDVSAGGYQVLLNYRSLHDQEKIADMVSLRDVLKVDDQINPELLKNRIVLIGVTAPSHGDSDHWKTPSHKKKIPGVFVQAHMVSHILSTVENNRPLLWWWSCWEEALWVWGWSLVGGIIAWRYLQPLYLGLAIAGALLALFGICFGIFTLAGWIPLVPPALAIVLTATTVVWKLRRTNSVIQTYRPN